MCNASAQLKKQDRFTTCFKTCGKGSLTQGVGGGCQVPLVLRLSKYVMNKYQASGYTIYLLINSILKIMLHLQMIYCTNVPYSVSTRRLNSTQNVSNLNGI